MKLYKFILSSLLALFAVSAFFIALYPGVIKGEALFPADLFYFYSPWKNIKPSGIDKPSNWILFDEILEFLPWRTYAKDSFASGIIPLWNPFSFCGYPFTGVCQTAVFYPPDRILDSLSFSAYTVARSLLHLWIAALGVFWLLRNLKTDRLCSLFGALTFSFCGFMVVWTGHPHFKTAAWMPFLFLFSRLFLKRKKIKFIYFFSFAVFMMITSGHIETALHILTALAIYWIYLFITEKNNTPRIAFLFCLAFIISAAATAVQIVPFAEYLINSSAYDVRSEGVVVQPYFPPETAMTFITPQLFGNDSKGNFWYGEFNSNETMAGFVGIWAVTAALYCLIRKLKNKDIQAFGILLFCSLAVAFGIPPFYQILHSFIVFKMSYNFRFLLVSAFCLSILAAKGLDQLKNARKYEHLALILPAAIFLAIISIRPFSPPSPEIIRKLNLSSHFYHIRLESILIIVSGVFAIAIASLIKKRRYRFLVPALFLLNVIDIFWNSFHYNRTFDPRLIAPPMESAQFINSDRDIFRVLPLGFAYPPHTNELYGFYDFRGNDALTPLAVEQYLNVVDPSITGPRVLPAMRLIKFRLFNHSLLHWLNIKYIITPNHTNLLDWARIGDKFNPENFPKIFEKQGIKIFENKRSFPRCFLSSKWSFTENHRETLAKLKQIGQIDSFHAYVEAGENSYPQPESNDKPSEEIISLPIRSYSPHKIEIDLNNCNPGLVVLSELFFPGWTAALDGKQVPLLKVNHMLRGVFLKENKQSLSFSYQPFSFKLGEYIMLLSLSLPGAAALCFILMRRNRT